MAVVCGCENGAAAAYIGRAATPLSQEIALVARNGGWGAEGSGPLTGCCCPAESANSDHRSSFRKAGGLFLNGQHCFNVRSSLLGSLNEFEDRNSLVFQLPMIV